jgi:hypothetical protein
MERRGRRDAENAEDFAEITTALEMDWIFIHEGSMF